MYPNVTINRPGIVQNFNVLNRLAQKQGVRISVVTKGLVGYAPLVQALIQSGVASICEAHVQNLKKFASYNVEKWMIRMPLPSEAAEVVRYADISLNTELATIRRLSQEAQKQGKTHKVVVMLELGELREGCTDDELLPLCEACMRLPGLELHGIGNNLSCYSGIVPDDQNMEHFVQAVHRVQSALGCPLPVVSGGNSSSTYRLQKGTLPPEVNHLRIGESVLMGTIACYDEPIVGGSSDNFTLTAEIIEVKDKKSMPYGSRAPGVPPVATSGEFEDRGMRKRALVAVGKQDVYVPDMVPHDPGLHILAATSDCFIADVTESRQQYKPGDTVQFSMKYHAMLSAMASDYVEKTML